MTASPPDSALHVDLSTEINAAFHDARATAATATTSAKQAVVRGLDHFRRWFHRRTDDLPLAKWTPEARRLLRNELTWFKKLHDGRAA